MTTTTGQLAAERRRIKRSLAIAVMHACRSIPDGEIRDGCVIYDGAQVRERLRQAWLAIEGEPPHGRATSNDPVPQPSVTNQPTD